MQFAAEAVKGARAAKSLNGKRRISKSSKKTCLGSKQEEEELRTLLGRHKMPP
jgi:hypothetical protein